MNPVEVYLSRDFFKLPTSFLSYHSSYPTSLPPTLNFEPILKIHNWGIAFLPPRS